jgi:hypothetical protein
MPILIWDHQLNKCHNILIQDWLNLSNTRIDSRNACN